MDADERIDKKKSDEGSEAIQRGIVEERKKLKEETGEAGNGTTVSASD